MHNLVFELTGKQAQQKYRPSKTDKTKCVTYSTLNVNAMTFFFINVAFLFTTV